jgi:hypothetical protein
MIPAGNLTLISSNPLPKVNNSLPPLREGRKERSRSIIYYVQYIPYYMHLLIMQTSIDEMHMNLQLSDTLVDSPINDSAHATYFKTKWRPNAMGKEQNAVAVDSPIVDWMTAHDKKRKK